MPSIRVSALLMVTLGALTLTGCVPSAAAPPASVQPTPEPTVAAAESVRPAARLALPCEKLVPAASSIGFGDPELQGVVDLDSATTAQAGWTWCTWASSAPAHLEVIVIPDGPVDSLWNEPCGQVPAGTACSAQVAAGSTVISVSALFSAVTPLGEADEAFAIVVETVAAVVAEEVVAPASPVQRTVPRGAVAGLDPATTAGWFGVDPDGDIPLGVPQEVLGETAYTQTESETVTWGTTGVDWAEVELLPGGGWAAAGLPNAEAAPFQTPSSFEPVTVAGLADAALTTSGRAFSVCGALGTDLVCVSSYGVAEDVFLAGVGAVVAELAGTVG